jgi:SRSO17 transposase
MRDFMNAAAQQRLREYFDLIGDLLGNQKRRESFAIYAMGLLGDGARKSFEPIACKACPDPNAADAAHQRLQHFATDSPWSDHSVRCGATTYALDAMTKREPVEVWITDDTGFLKQGKHSVGVQRQYTGSAGKVANCQIGVSLSVATRTEHIPIDFELYLPKSWTDDPARMRQARVPEGVAFQTKPEIALGMIRRAVNDGVPKGVVLGDSAYGTSKDFRRGLRELNLHYALGVDPKTSVLLLNKRERVQGPALSVRDLAFLIRDRNGFRRCTWRKGTNDDLSAKFALRRVVIAEEGDTAPDKREPLWLVIEWRDGEDEPANYFLSSLSTRCTKKQLIRIIMQRWRTERVYLDLKEELGLDHFEGRRFPGWHHHVSVALSCYAFIVAERVRRFPPSAGRSSQADSLQLSA